MAKRILIDTSKCDDCAECTVTCSYLYQPHLTDHGITSLRELINYVLVCRRCENPSCVAACRFEALERQPDGVLKRYNMRCVSCKSCSHACPFGTIYPELTPFYAVRCDYCVSKLQAGNPGCLSSCAKGAVEIREVEESEKEGIFIVNEYLAAKAPRWNKKNV